MSASSDFAELSSLNSQLQEPPPRGAAAPDRTRYTDDSAVASEIDQAERGLIGASRSLDRAIGMLQ